MFPKTYFLNVIDSNDTNEYVDDYCRNHNPIVRRNEKQFVFLLVEHHVRKGAKVSKKLKRVGTDLKFLRRDIDELYVVRSIIRLFCCRVKGTQPHEMLQ